jgi:rhodanese-related sulfurtransferase
MSKIFRMLWLSVAVVMNTCCAGYAADEPVRGKEMKKPPQLVEVAEAEKLIAAKRVVVLDVRTPGEYALGHIAGATNIDFHAKTFQSTLEKLDKSQAYLVHCAVGGRSARASSLMSGLDFKSVYDLKGGLKAWEKAGKPVVK